MVRNYDVLALKQESGALVGQSRAGQRDRLTRNSQASEQASEPAQISFTRHFHDIQSRSSIGTRSRARHRTVRGDPGQGQVVDKKQRRIALLGAVIPAVAM